MRLLFTTLFLALTLGLFAQESRDCATMDVLEQQLQQDPGMADRMEAIERHTERFQHEHTGDGRMVVTIPVVFHIVHNGDALGTNENLPESLILAQLEQLNLDFALLNSDASQIPPIFQGVAANTEIQFCLAQRAPDGTATTGINRVNGGQASWSTSQINNTLKPNTIWDRNQYLNVWSVVFSSSGLLGFAQFPGGNASTDGIVVRFSTVGSVALPNPAGGSFARGRTATHEVGHWLNLRHIWGDATCGNDLVADTPVHNTSNSGCPTYPHLSTCTGNPVEMTMNYMDYTNDVCMFMFTAGQKARMQAVLAPGGFRFSLNNSLGCVSPTPVCGVPTGLTATNLTTTSATLNWNALPDATSYNVRWRAVGASTWNNISLGGTSTNLTNLNASTQYEFQVQAVCEFGTGNFSASSTFTTAAPPACGTPTGLSAINITTGSATLTWNAVGGATSYTARWRRVGTSTWTTETTPGLAVNATGLTPNATYEFQVQAVCNGIQGLFSASANFTTLPDVGCGTPSGLFANNLTANSATLNWNAVGAAVSYNVRWRPVGSSMWTNGSSATNSLAIAGLGAGVQYEFQVQTQCAREESNYSASANFTTLAGTSCGTPTGLSASNVTANSATLNWNTVSGATSYDLRWRPVGSGVWTNGTSATNSQNIGGLVAATTYEFEVRAVCGATVGNYSPAANFTTLAGASCGTPTGLSASNVTANSATLNWNTVSGATSYNLRWRPVGSSTWITGSAVTTSLPVSGLLASTTYEFEVQAVCGANPGSFSPAANFTTLAGSGGNCTDNFEPNNSPSPGLPLVALGVGLEAQIANASDVDWYRTSTSRNARNVRVDLTNLPANYDLELYDGATLLATSQNAGTADESIVVNFAPVSTTLYVKVVGVGGASSSTDCYTLQVDVSSSPFRFEGTAATVPAAAGFRFFPNPANTQVTVEVEAVAASRVAVQILDVTGKAVRSQTFTIDEYQTQLTLDVSQLPAGMYLLRVENGHQLGAQKLAIVRE